MVRRTLLLSLMFTPLLTGCATFSFAPPSVNLEKRVSAASSTSCTATPGSELVNDHNSVEGTLFLIDNYAQAYGCALATTSNGRQLFQIPSHLAALVGVGGAAFGGGKDLALSAGIAASAFNSGNAYWAPQDKAVVIDSAYDAILCIRAEAVGMPFIETRDGKPAEIEEAGGKTISIDARWRFYGLISAALRQVDRLAASRLRSIGKFDPAGLVAEIEALNKKIAEAEKDRGTDNPAPNPTPSPSPSPSPTPSPAASDNPGGPPQVTDGETGGNGAAKPRARAGTDHYPLDLELLAPKIQRCVVRAKM